MYPFSLGFHAPFGVYMYVQRYYICLGGMHVYVDVYGWVVVLCTHTKYLLWE